MSHASVDFSFKIRLLVTFCGKNCLLSHQRLVKEVSGQLQTVLIKVDAGSVKEVGGISARRSASQAARPGSAKTENKFSCPMPVAI